LTKTPQTLDSSKTFKIVKVARSAEESLSFKLNSMNLKTVQR